MKKPNRFAPIPIPDLRGDAHAEFAAAFWANVDQSGGPDACWPWTGRRHHRRTRTGRLFDYGVARFRGRRRVFAHRLAYALTKGEVPRGAQVNHSCDNCPCVNPRHLHLGDQTRNLGEMAIRGRSTARFSPEQADEMRRLRAEGMTYREIAARFGAHVNTVGHLVAWGLKSHRYTRYLPTSIRARLPVRTPIAERVNLELADCLIASGWTLSEAAAWLGVHADSLLYALRRAQGRGRTSLRPMPAMSSRVAALVRDHALAAPLLWVAGGLASDGPFARTARTDEPGAA